MSLLPLELPRLTPEEAVQLHQARWEKLGQGTFHKVYCSRNRMTFRHHTCQWVIKYPFSNTAWIVLSKDPVIAPDLINQIFEKNDHDAIIVCYDTRRYFFYKDPLHPLGDETISLKFELISFAEESEKAWKCAGFKADTIYKLTLAHLENILKYSRQQLPSYLFHYLKPLDRASSHRNVRYWNLMNWSERNKKAPAYFVEDSAWIAPYIPESFVTDEEVKKTLIDYYLDSGTMVPDGYAPTNMRSGICIDPDWAFRRRAGSPVSEELAKEAMMVPYWRQYHQFFERDWPQSQVLVIVLLYLSQYVDYTETIPEHLSGEMMPVLFCFHKAKQPINVEILNTLLEQSALIWAAQQPLLPLLLMTFLLRNSVCSLRLRDVHGNNVLDYLEARAPLCESTKEILVILFDEIKVLPRAEQKVCLSQGGRLACQHIYQYMLLLYQELFECTWDDVSVSRLSEEEFFYLKRLHRCFLFLGFKEAIDGLELYGRHANDDVFQENVVLLKKVRQDLVCLEDLTDAERHMNTFCDESITLTRRLLGRLPAVEYSPVFFSSPRSSDAHIDNLRSMLSRFLSQFSKLKEQLSEASYVLVEAAHR